MATIYYAQESTNGNLYIGSTKREPTLRWKEHIKRLNAGTHENRRMQSAWSKTKGCFAWGVISECEQSQRLQTEQFYVDIYKPYFNIWRKVRFGAEGARSQVVEQIQKEIVVILANCGMLKALLKWNGRLSGFFGFKVTHFNAGIKNRGTGKGGRGVPKSPKHRAAIAASRNGKKYPRNDRMFY